MNETGRAQLKSEAVRTLTDEIICSPGCLHRQPWRSPTAKNRTGGC